MEEWAWNLGKPGARGVIRAQLEDFRVWELPLIEPTGEGSHLWLEVEKRNANTNWVAEQLAAQAGVRSRDVGFAGMKDRRGVTTQWFSVAMQEAASADWPKWRIQDASIIQGCRHGRKLKRGALKGNHFRIVVRELAADAAQLDSRLQAIAAQGVPNYFGPQRFGHGGLNVERGIHWLQNGGRLTRSKKSIYLSAVRSYLFNRVLSERVQRENWNLILDGEVAVLDGSHSIFPCTIPDAEIERRCTEFDIHPSGPLAGDGGRILPAREAAEIEYSVLAPDQPVIDALAAARVESARRSLRIKPWAFKWQQDGADLVLEFGLPPGAYATSVLRELVSTEQGTISDSV